MYINELRLNSQSKVVQELVKLTTTLEKNDICMLEPISMFTKVLPSSTDNVGATSLSPLRPSTFSLQ